MDVYQPLPQVGVLGERPGGVLQQLLPGHSNRGLWGVVLSRRLPGGIQSGVRVCGGDEAGDESLERRALRSGFDDLTVLGGQVTVQPGEAAGE